MQEQLQLVHEKEQVIPGSVQYGISRYRKFPQWNMEDMGMMMYHYEPAAPANNYLQLRFCVSGNMYCKQKDVECDNCKLNLSRNCTEKVETADVLSFTFSSSHLLQFVKTKGINSGLSDNIVHFKHRSSFSKYYLLRSHVWWKRCSAILIAVVWKISISMRKLRCSCYIAWNA